MHFGEGMNNELYRKAYISLDPEIRTCCLVRPPGWDQAVPDPEASRHLPRTVLTKLGVFPFRCYWRDSERCTVALGWQQEQ